jgi:hypothetical protein
MVAAVYQGFFKPKVLDTDQSLGRFTASRIFKVE